MINIIFGHGVYFGLWLFGMGAKRVPYPAQVVIGVCFGFMFCLLAPGRAWVAWDNLRRVFPSKPPSERWRIFTRFLLHLGLCFWEWVCMPAMGPKDIRKKVHLQNDVLRDLLTKHGGLLLLSHMGNWELMLAFAAQEIGPISVVYRPFRWKWLEVCWNRVRQTLGVEVIAESHNTFQVMRKLGQKQAIGVMQDQHVPQGVGIPFFGLQVGASSFLASLQMRSHQYVFPMYVYRDFKNGKQVLILDGKLNPEQRRLEEYQNQLHDSALKYQTYIEKWIRLHPEQWLWTAHRFEGK